MNFRASYLASLGFQHKKIAKSEIGGLFAEDVVPLNQLRRHCLRVGVEARWRGAAWKLLLGVIPPEHAAWDVASQTRLQMYEDLVLASSAVLRVNNNVREDRLIAAFALHAVLSRRGKNPARGFPSANSIKTFLQHDEAERARTVLRIMCRVFSSEWEAFWCTVRFIQAQRIVAVLKRTGTQLQSWGVAYRVRLLSQLLTKEPELSKLLHEIGIKEENFATIWFRTYLADVLREDDVVALWDHVIAAPADFVSYFSLEVLKYLQPKIEKLRSDRGAVLEMLTKVPLLGDLGPFAEPAADATANLIDKDHHHDPLLTFDVEWPVLHFGDRGVLVKALQLLLRNRGFGGMFSVDGTYGQRTETALSNWKRMKNAEAGALGNMKNRSKAGSDADLSAIDQGSYGSGKSSFDLNQHRNMELTTRAPLRNGSTDDVSTVASSVDTQDFATPPKNSSTLGRVDLSLRPVASASTAAAKNAALWDGDRTVGANLWSSLIQSISAGARGDAVRALQALLLHEHSYGSVREDGYFGTQTLIAVKDFQANVAARAIPIDGIVGPVTWIHLLNVRDENE
mmetsp:Transcript_36/g.102  ORF Transcript_36/g.102 Transcript_36/m.102 type:complete len:568 (+) Transcript_36:170-1873(+)|eukprot:CAMPEP_0198728894 /NCGR_PEP_ID=MMETSP1475-20131203/11895_1 /TAXON_ID= ORGANISM="Unidentified sp., Strain CCMP1999" /NCGR_SAMPLE_ID=MMETSP1475 /ASSEMBLY_ACC=CAM_ASM_001111 /LENGTH=567 /DNA_ID=CAMNT_0044491371 /DNA_START=169 /DNA_END=1872 /DNA_ORIENTATION=+